MAHIDARGKPCPQPVTMTKAALSDNPQSITVRVDDPESAQNVSRFLKSQGYTISLSAEDDDIIIDGVKASAGPEPQQKTPEPAPAMAVPSPSEGKRAVFISHSVIGGDDKELGEVLIKAFLGTLAQLDPSERPAVVALMNEGVKLAVRGTSTAEALQEYLDQGGSLLVCGTCLNHFNLTDQLGVGQVSNIYEIASTLMACQTLSL